MVYWTGLVLAAVVSIQARKFDNPILSKHPYAHPSAIKVDGTYYLVAQSNYIFGGIFPIHTSTDLVHWEPAGFVFNDTNMPKWADRASFGSPAIHKIGLNFLVYFSAYTTIGIVENLGVAVGPHPLGPYSALDRPMVSQKDVRSWFPSIVNDAKDDKLYLLWANETSSIFLRQLHPNGLSFSSEQTRIVLRPTFDWESNVIYSPFHIKREQFHYIFYDSSTSGVGVARSSHVFGPYSKLKSSFLLSKNGYSNPVEVSIVPDLDDENDVIFLQAKVNLSIVVILASLSWDNGQPVVGPF